MSPVIKAEIPETIAAINVSARAGLPAISSKIVLPAGTDLYNEFAKDEPVKNNNGIAAISPRDHLPNIVFGINFSILFYRNLLPFVFCWQILLVQKFEIQC